MLSLKMSHSKCRARTTYHGRDLAGCLQKLNDLALVRRLHACKQSGVLDRARLVVVGQIVKLTTGERLPIRALSLIEHADTAADRLSRRLATESVNP